MRSVGSSSLFGRPAAEPSPVSCQRKRRRHHRSQIRRLFVRVGWERLALEGIHSMA